MREYLGLHKEKIDDTIQEIINKEAEEYTNYSEELKKYLDMFQGTTEGGKRIRAVLVLLGYEMCGGSINSEIYKAAAGYEIFQSGILIHDDVIDQSELRRGRRTIHTLLGNDHQAMSNAICLGDYGIFLSQKVMSELDFKAEDLVRALKIYNKTIVNTVAGEILDVNLPYIENPTEDNIYNIAYYKTSWYTIIGPMMLGAILAGADDNVLYNIRKFGKHLGIAFQMKDDLLGIFGDEKIVGKPITSDIEEKKLTLLYTHVLENASDEDREVFLKYYGKKDVTLEECDIVREIMTRYFSEHKVEEVISHEVVEAKKYLNEITQDEKWRNVLENLIVELTVRDK